MKLKDWRALLEKEIENVSELIDKVLDGEASDSSEESTEEE